MPLPGNILFLDGAAKELLRIKANSPSAYGAILDALVSLGQDGPPNETMLVPIDEPPFPLGIAYRFDAAGYTIVFESDKRVVHRSGTGLQVVRSIRAGYPLPRYTIWAIMAAESK